MAQTHQSELENNGRMTLTDRGVLTSLHGLARVHHRPHHPHPQQAPFLHCCCCCCCCSISFNVPLVCWARKGAMPRRLGPSTAPMREPTREQLVRQGQLFKERLTNRASPGSRSASGTSRSFSISIHACPPPWSPPGIAKQCTECLPANGNWVSPIPPI